MISIFQCFGFVFIKSVIFIRKSLFKNVLVLGFIYHRYRSKKILRKWELEEELANIEWNDEFPN